MNFFESLKYTKKIPTYEQALEACSHADSPFYESKKVVHGFNVSIFNYRIAQYQDFVDNNAFELRGLTFVFNKDCSVFKHFLLLEKFFNLNQVPSTQYSIVKEYKIKYVNNKEDGSIASFIQTPNGLVVGKSKMSFDSIQAIAITRIYNTNNDIKQFVDWCLINNIDAIFEYVARTNRIVLEYDKEELILLRLRDNKTGNHIDLKKHFDKIGNIKIAPFDDDHKDLDHLIEFIGKEENKEGVVVQTTDSDGNDFFYKLKTPWYISLHNLFMEDIHREDVIINYILDDKIDDLLGQIPEKEIEMHERIEKIIHVVKLAINNKIKEIQRLYDVYDKIGSVKEFAIKYNKDENFSYVMCLVNCERLQSLSIEEISELYPDYSVYEKRLADNDIYELAKNYIYNKVKKLESARIWLYNEDPSLIIKNE